MSMYASLSDLKKTLPEEKILNLCFDTEDGGTKDIADSFIVDKYEEALSDATAEIDTYIARVHPTIPLTVPIPDRIVKCTCRLAAYMLYERRDYSYDTNPKSGSYENELAWLKQLARGDVHVNFGTVADPDERRLDRIRTNADPDNNEKEFDGSAF